MKIKIFIIKIGIFFLNIIYSFFKLFKTQNKITFISRQSNSITLDYKILSNKINEEMNDYKTVILCKKLENKLSYIFHMFRQMYHIATSKVVILDSYCIAISVLKHKKSLNVIQIWHAVGSMKKFGYAMIDKKEGTKKEIAQVMKMHKNYDYVLISSMNYVKDFIEGFNINKDIIKEIPLPRVDLLIDREYKNKKREELYKKIPELKDKKNILYCSTFRKEENNNKHIYDLIDCIDFSKYNLLYQPHPLSKEKFDDKRVIKDFNSTFDALFVADYVISDYSSIIYEAGLLNLPVYIYAYDWDLYKTKREINYDIEHDTPTIFTKNPKIIINAIESNNFNIKKFKEFINKNVTIPKNGCCNSTIELIKEIVNYKEK